MITLFAVVGFSLVWAIGITVAGGIIISLSGRNPSPYASEAGAFVFGLATGPFALLALMNQRAIASGTAGARLWGGIIGSVLAYAVYSSL